MTTKTKAEKQVAEEKQESKIQPSDYSCEILLEKTIRFGFSPYLS